MTVDRIDAKPVERDRVVDRLAGRLHAVARRGVADREALPVDRAHRHRKAVGVGARELRDVGGDVTVAAIAHGVEHPGDLRAERGEVGDHQIAG